jgi:hypothetical protein
VLIAYPPPQIQHNKNALTHYFMYLAKLCRKYATQGGEDSLVPLEITVAELSKAPPDTCEDKLALFFQTELVEDRTSAIVTTDMMEAVGNFLARYGEPRATTTAQQKLLAATTKTVFDSAFTWLPLRTNGRKIRPVFEKSTLADPKFKNKYAFCRVMLCPAKPAEPVHVAAEPFVEEVAAEPFVEEVAAEPFVEEEQPLGTYDLLGDVDVQQAVAAEAAIAQWAREGEAAELEALSQAAQAAHAAQAAGA